MRGAIQVQRSETLRQQAITRIAQGIREQLSRDDLAQAESELAAARTRYPGESAWASYRPTWMRGSICSGAKPISRRP